MTRDCLDISETDGHQSSRGILLWCSTKSSQSGQVFYRHREFGRIYLGMSAGSYTDTAAEEVEVEVG